MRHNAAACFPPPEHLPLNLFNGPMLLNGHQCHSFFSISQTCLWVHSSFECSLVKLMVRGSGRQFLQFISVFHSVHVNFDDYNRCSSMIMLLYAGYFSFRRIKFLETRATTKDTFYYSIHSSSDGSLDGECSSKSVWPTTNALLIVILTRSWQPSSWEPSGMHHIPKSPERQRMSEGGREMERKKQVHGFTRKKDIECIWKLFTTPSSGGSAGKEAILSCLSCRRSIKLYYMGMVPTWGNATIIIIIMYMPAVFSCIWLCISRMRNGKRGSW